MTGAQKRTAENGGVDNSGGDRPENARLRALPRCFEPAHCPPPAADALPKKVVVLMRHGDRTCIPQKIGILDLSHLAPVWEGLMPSPEDQASLERFPVQQGNQDGNNAYAKFVGDRPWGHLTASGVAQCKAVGAELRRRYPTASIRAYSTNFPRTKQSAAAVLLGFGAAEDVPVIVRSPCDEVLLPNFDGRCRRFAEIRSNIATELKTSSLKQAYKDLEMDLRPLIGEEWAPALDFRPLCIHEDVVGVVPGLSWDLMHRVEKYYASLEGAIFEHSECRRLGCGRLLRWVIDLLAEAGHEVILLQAHDNMLAAFLSSLGIDRGDWPIYASAVVLETADFQGNLRVRVHVNNNVRIDWLSWDEFTQLLKPFTMSSDEYEDACSSDAN